MTTTTTTIQRPGVPPAAGRAAERQRWRRTARWRARVADLATRDADRAVREVAGCWVRDGHGPTWSELGRALGWPAGMVDAAVRALVAGGRLEAGTQARSLNVAGQLAAPPPEREP